MSDIDQAKVELTEALKRAQSEAVYLETAARALESAVVEAGAVQQHIENALQLLSGEPPVSVPVATLHDAMDAAPGEVMVFKLTLSTPAVGAVSARISSKVGTASAIEGTVVLDPGEVIIDVQVMIPAGTADGTSVTATIVSIDGAEVGDRIAAGIVEAPPSTSEPIYTGIDVKTVQSIETAQQEVTLIAVVRAKAAATTYEKIAGRDAAEHAKGGWCIERTDKGVLRCWAGGANNEAEFIVGSPMTVGMAMPVGFRVALNGTMTAALGHQSITVEDIATFTGPVSVGDGWWQHNRRDPWQGDILSVVVWDHALPAEDYGQQFALAQLIADKANGGE